MFVTILTRRMLSIANSIHNGLPWGVPPLWLNVKLKCLCSVHRETFWPCPLVKGCAKEINTSPLWCWPTQQIFCKNYGLLILLPHLLPLSYKRNWQPDPDKMVLEDAGLPSFQTPGFPNKVTISPLLIYWPVIWQADQAWFGDRGDYFMGEERLKVPETPRVQAIKSKQPDWSSRVHSIHPR